MKILFFISLICLVVGMGFAAPLATGYALAPKSTASQAEKQKAYLEARNLVIDAALKYENTPYVYGGMSSKGVDCSGFICLSFKDALGVNLPRSAAGLYSWVEKIPLDKAQPGDLIFFKTDGTGNITHVGLYLGNRRFIHAASAGAKTGVIFNTLDEGNWTRNFGGTGRVLPEVDQKLFKDTSKANQNINTNHSASSAPAYASGTAPVTTAPVPSASVLTEAQQKEGVHFLVGAAFAPTWNNFFLESNILRGFTSQFRMALDTSFFKNRIILGFELRPEYDGTLAVFRLPFTLSLGATDKFRVFAGPVLSIGDAVIATENGNRNYSGGTSWFGTVGITFAPVIVNTDIGNFAVYGEVAWQSYFSDNNSYNASADITAVFRISTGIRWTMRIRKD